MSLPTSASIDAAIPVAGTPSRSLTNAALKAILAIAPSDIGLGNVSNTSDANKPVSAAQAAAIAAAPGVPAPGNFYPTAAGGSTAIQAAIAAATAAGGGTVRLGNATWVMTAGIVFDPTIISLIGDSTVLDFSALGDVPFITMTEGTSGNYKVNFRQRVQGLQIKGSATTKGTGLYFYTPSGSDYSSGLTVENCTISNCKIGTTIGDNGYLMRFISCSFSNVTNSVTRSSSVNNGEAINFYGCTFAGSAKAIAVSGPNLDLYFFGCSFDYNQQVAYTDALLEFHGCHFESNSATTNGLRQFESDNGGIMRFFGGNIGLVNNSGGTAPDYLFYAYPTNGGGNYSINDTDIGSYFGNQFTSGLCGPPEKMKINGNKQGATVTATGVLSLSSIGAITPVNAATATVFTLPSAAAAWALVPFALVILMQKGAGAPTFAPAGSDLLRATSGIAASVQYGMIAAQIISATEWALA